MCGLRAYMDLMGLLKLSERKLMKIGAAGICLMFNIFQIYNELWDVVAVGCC